MPDKTIVCKDCGKPFVFTEVQEANLRKLVADGRITEFHEPKRCRPCREAKKQSMRSQGG